MGCDNIISRFFELQTCYIELNSTDLPASATNTSPLEPAVCTTDLRESYEYCRDYLLIGNFLLMALLPFLLLGVFNGLTFHMIRTVSSRQATTSRRQERDHTIAIMLSSVVLVFFVCGSLRIVLNLWEVWRINAVRWIILQEASQKITLMSRRRPVHAKSGDCHNGLVK